MKSVIEMAKEAGFDSVDSRIYKNWLERFATIVREEKEAEFAKRLEDIMPVLQQEWYLKGQEDERENSDLTLAYMCGYEKGKDDALADYNWLKAKLQRLERMKKK